MSDYNVIYIQGSKGEFADMDVDCDGEQNGRGDDGRCGSSDDTQSITSFQYIVESYGKGINDLNAYVHPYVVFGNEGSKSGWKTFDPEKYGIKPLSVMAVVCNGKLVSSPLFPSPVLPLLSSFSFSFSPKLSLINLLPTTVSKHRSTESGETKTVMTGTSPWWVRHPSRWPRPASAPA